MVVFHSERESVSNAPARRMAAVLTRMLQGPSAFSTASAAAVTLAASVVSHGATTGSAPSARSSPRVASRPFSSRSMTATLAPALAKLTAVARPMPPPPPVITATRPDRPSQSLDSCAGAAIVFSHPVMFDRHYKRRLVGCYMQYKTDCPAIRHGRQGCFGRGKLLQTM